MAQHKLAWTFGITTAALFMTALDNLVVVTAIPVIQRDLHATLSDLEWTVNAYTLTFAVLLLTGAALGDRFGRKRLFVIGLTIFTLASALAAVSHDINLLLLARTLQGLGAAIVTPLTLTILAHATPPEKRGALIGAWGGIAGLAVAIGPVVGGALVTGIAWQWIFWLNVPIGAIAIPLALRKLDESVGPSSHLDFQGLILASGGLFGIVWGLVRANEIGWTSAEVVTVLIGGAALLVGFLLWEARTATPMLPLRFFKGRAFAAANAASVLMYFGMFGSIFLLTQFLQTVQHYSALGAGVRMLAWTGVTMFVAPPAGILSDKIGGRPLMVAGLVFQSVGLAWMVAIATPTVPFSHLVAPFVLAGIGMGLFFAPVANVVLASVRPEEEGQASGANNALRELGGVFGIAVLAAIFAQKGHYPAPPDFSGQPFVDGLKIAVYVGAGLVALGAIVCLAVPRARNVWAESGTPGQPPEGAVPAADV
jgi:EmrB/QacA subfamily drug resistance transporter